MNIFSGTVPSVVPAGRSSSTSGSNALQREYSRSQSSAWMETGIWDSNSNIPTSFFHSKPARVNHIYWANTFLLYSSKISIHSIFAPEDLSVSSSPGNVTNEGENICQMFFFLNLNPFFLIESNQTGSWCWIYLYEQLFYLAPFMALLLITHVGTGLQGWLLT